MPPSNETVLCHFCDKQFPARGIQTHIRLTHSVSQHLSTIEYITRVLCNLEMVMHNTGEIAAKCMIFLFILAYLDYGNARISMTGSILVAFQGYKDMLIGNEVAEIGTFLLEDNEDSKRMIEVMRTPQSIRNEVLGFNRDSNNFQKVVLDEYEILLNKAISFLKTTEEENDDNPTEIARLFEYLRKKCEADELSSTSEKTITVDTTTSMGPQNQTIYRMLTCKEKEDLDMLCAQDYTHGIMPICDKNVPLYIPAC